MVKGKTSLHRTFVLAYLIGKCIDHLEGEKEERALVAWCIEALRGRERLRVVHNGTLYFPFTEYQIDKVPMDVASFLVFNHVNIGVLCLIVLCLFLCVW